MAVSKRVRYEVMRRDNHACRYCGAMAPDVKLTIDHVMPVALGGDDSSGNLVTACVDCNAGKTSVAPDQAVVDDVGADALRWSAAMKAAGEMLAAKDEPLEAYIKAFSDKWDEWSTGGSWDPKPIGKPSGWRDSITAFYRAQLSQESLLRAVSIAMNKDNVAPSATFRYFCGVCWRMLDEQRAIAQALIASEEAESGS